MCASEDASLGAQMALYAPPPHAPASPTASPGHPKRIPRHPDNPAKMAAPMPQPGFIILIPIPIPPMILVDSPDDLGCSERLGVGSGMLGDARGCSGMLGDGWVMLEISVRSEEASGKRAGDGWGKGQLSGADEP